MAAKDDAPKAKPTAEQPASTEKKTVYRVDLGEGIPTPPLKTATDNE